MKRIEPETRSRARALFAGGAALAATFAFLCAFAGTVSAQPANAPAKLPGQVSIAQRLGAQLPMDAMFRDENGNIVRLGDYFRSGRPVIFNFVYYRCPMLCSLVLEGTTDALTELKLNAGKDFDLVTISIDPRDQPKDAIEKKAKYVKRYGRAGASTAWHFLTGNDSTIHRVTAAAGFQYAYDPQSDQFAHPAVLMVLTPEGRLARYFYGIQYKPSDVRMALVEASHNKIGTPTDQLLLLCFHYDASQGKYTATAMNFVRAGGVVTVLALGGFIFVMLRHEKRETPGSKESDTR